MRRTSSLSAKTPIKQTEQRTLHGFFPPQGPAATVDKDTTPIGSDAIVSILEQSSDEDELVATNQLLGPRRSTRKPTGKFEVVIPSPEKRHVKRSRTEQDSPPPKVSQYAGTFNLMALLEDRNNRLEQKQIMEKLEHSHTPDRGAQDSSEHDTSTEVSLDHKSGRLDQLLHMNKKQLHPEWHTVRIADGKSDARPPRIPKHLLRDLPTRGSIDADGMSAAYKYCAHLCTYIVLQRLALSPDVLPFISECFLASKDIGLIGKIYHAWTQAPMKVQDISALLARCMGYTGEFERRVASDDVFLVSTNHIIPDRVLVAKLRAILHLLCAVVSRQDSSGRCAVEESVVQLVLLLYLDSSYGVLLTAEIAEFLRIHGDRLTETHHNPYISLVDVCSRSRDQLRLIQVLPVQSDAAVEQTQRQAAMYFLGLKKVDAAAVESPEQRLRLLLSFLRESPPFHPLTQDTSYPELGQKIALLSHATTSIATRYFDHVRELVNDLQALHGRIVDSKAAFIVRSEAKAAIQRLADRLKYTLEAQKRKSSIFEHFK